MKPLRILLMLLLAATWISHGQNAPALNGEGQAQLAFSDLGESPFREAIAQLAANGFMGGFPDGTFRPDRQVTRAEFVIATLRAANPEAAAETTGDCSAELPADAWYTVEFCSAIGQEIIAGDTAGFRPEAALTFAEALKILITSFHLKAGSTQAAEGTDWFEPYREFAGASGLLPDGSYDPDAPVTREVAAGLLYRTLILLQDPASLPPLDGEALLAASVAAAVQAGRKEQPEPGMTGGCHAPRSGVPEVLVVAGRERRIITHVPAGYDGSPVSLVIAFHGRTNSNSQARGYMDLDEAAPGSIIVYPAGIPLATGGYSWSDNGDGAESLRDYELFDVIVDSMSAAFCLDLNRIFVVGHSLGAWFANSLACARADVIRAAATVAGGITASGCSGEVAALLLHNPDDALVAITEGEKAREMFLAGNGLLSAAAVALPGPFNCTAYGPESGNPVVWCPHDIDRPYGNRYDPHGWPAGTGGLIMEFFAGFR
jgi:polyhydroxybutyrate depolymerase